MADAARRSRTMKRTFVMLRWCDSLRIPRAAEMRALESTGRVRELDFANNSTSQHVIEILVNAFSNHLNANETSRLLFYRNIGSTSVLTQTGTANDMCGQTLRTMYSRVTAKVFMRLTLDGRDTTAEQPDDQQSDPSQQREKAYAVVPSYLPVPGIQADRDLLVVEYFHQGFTYKEILGFLLLMHGITLSLRQLKRVIASHGLRRRGLQQRSSMQATLNAIEEEFSGSGSIIGYRQMHQRLRLDHGLHVDRETVRIAMSVLDPEGVRLRQRKRFARRRYMTKGPNYIWHIDGYDKLKPYGFAIHGCIDGYSRRIIWLEVGPSNNNPAIVAKYFVDAVRVVQGVPRIIRLDLGTENTSLADIQAVLRMDCQDSFAGHKSYLFGKSTGNQRIECWWSFLRKSDADWWMSFFTELRERGIYNDGDPLHLECLRFCFTALIQRELHRVARHWNLHRIRPYKMYDCPHGRPDVLFFLPQLQGTVDYRSGVIPGDLDILEQELCTERPANGCSDACNELASIAMEEEGITEMPESAEEALNLFCKLIQFIERHA